MPLHALSEPLQELTPEQLVLRATDPSASAWVSANAGAGKTRLLTNRVLRLLLGGVAPPRILCITFTTAASAEMKTRVHQELSRWSVMEEDMLAAALSELTGSEVGEVMRQRARTLFSAVLDAPEGIRIQTIHGFCQSLLRRFPLEAGAPPNFSVIDERSADELVREAVMRLYRHAGEGGEVAGALRFMAGQLSESSFRDMVRELVGERKRLHRTLREKGGVAALEAALYRALHLPPHAVRESVLEAQFLYTAAERAALREAAERMVGSKGVNDIRFGAQLLAWLEGLPGFAALDGYLDIFITKEGSPRKQIHGKHTLPERLAAALEGERIRAEHAAAQLRALKVAQMSASFMRVADGLIAQYERLKAERAVLDYDDLILTARDLLRRPGIAPWVLYKLDGGIDHVLVDEAQDTSPEQWDIVSALTDEFFSGQGARAPDERTLFVVGDEKQSIYSFQGADPLAFARMRAHFRERARDVGKPFREIGMLRSYRSAAPVLKAVDAVLQLVPGQEESRHVLTREGQAGRVEIWPLVEPDEKEELTPWELPLIARQQRQPALKLAECLAEYVASRLKAGEWLPAKGRALRASDILVLVRRRSGFVDTLIRHLKRRGVPVAGVDRMALNENLAVQDMLALGKFLVLPEDDLTLAALLRSPMFDIGEEALFTLAHGREQSLWERLLESEAEGPCEAAQRLSHWREKACRCTPYALFAYVLEACGARKRITGRMGGEYNDPLDEFLNQALAYESQHPPSLQGFLHWLERGETVVKRDMEQGGEGLRIMTVHGAKGLQAPTVILPDTMGVPKPRARLLWCSQGERGGGLAFWSPSSKTDDAVTAGLRAARREEELHEYRRLLYVAMTRAEDELILCGYRGGDKSTEEPWYALARRALEPLAECSETPCGEGLRIAEGVAQAEAEIKAETARPPVELPAFLTRLAPDEEPSPARMLTQPVFSPFSESGFYHRGRLVAALAARLPEIDPDARLEEALRILQRLDHQLGASAQVRLAETVTRLIGAEEWRELFGTGGMRDAQLCGYVPTESGDAALTCQADRLRVTPGEVWLLAVETHRHPVRLFSGALPPVLARLGTCRVLASRIYPGKRVRACVLWAAAPSIAEIPADAFTEARALPA